MEVMKVYLIVGYNDLDVENEDILAVVATKHDADVFLSWYKAGINVADFTEYDNYDIETHKLLTFEGMMSHTGEEENRE